MAKRKVYGRRRADFDGHTYVIELRSDGLWVRRLYHSEEVQITFNRIIQYSVPQLDLGLTFEEYIHGLDTSKHEGAVSAVPKGQLVPGEPEGGTDHLHAGNQQPTKEDEGREPGLDSPTGLATATSIAADEERSRPTNDQLSSVD